MLDQNVKESTLIKEEMSSIRNCITAYMSYIIGGSGISFVFITFINKANNNNGFRLFLVLGTCFIITSVYYMLIYKYISHNRYSGYLRLLTQEIKHESTGFAKDTEREKTTQTEANSENTPKQDSPKNFLVWELIMSKLLYAKSTTSFPDKYWTKQLKFFLKVKDGTYTRSQLYNHNQKLFKELWHGYSLDNPTKDQNSFVNGIEMIFKGIFNSDISKSWKYPLYTSYIVFVLYGIMQIIGLYLFLVVLYHDIGKENPMYIDTLKFWFEIVGYIIAQFFLVFIWGRNISQLYKIMKGSRTIDAFCWKFLQFRVEILNQYGFIPTYQLTNNGIQVPIDEPV